MKPMLYLLAASVAFLIGTAGSDLIARTLIAGETLGQAVADHLHWAGAQPIGTALLFAPFFLVGMISAGVERWGRTRSAVLVFAAGSLTLLYFYFSSYQAAQHALLEGRWTAAALAIGLLPFAVGAPVVFVLGLTGALAIGVHRRTQDRAN